MIAFSSAEIVQMARDIEKDGAAFYRRAASGRDDSDLGGLLLRLAEMEDQHERTFAELASQLSGAQRAGLFDPDDQARLYLQAMVEGKVVDADTALADAPSGPEGARAILRTALGLEERSILFYLGMKGSTTNEQARRKVEEIIAEEMTHVSLLRREMSEIR
jgi:rubrerythrin